MNIQNIDKAIAIMKRAQARDSVDMRTFQTRMRFEYEYQDTEVEFHACGNKACFAGHIAVSPEWIADGGRMALINGEPYKRIDGCIRYSSRSIGHWFGVSHLILEWMIHNPSEATALHKLYGVVWEDVRAEHVIRILEELKTLGEETFAKKYEIAI